MQLSPTDARDFLRIHASVLHYLYQLDPNTDPIVNDAAEFMRLPNEARIEYHDWLSESPELIDEYIHDNPDGLTQSELNDVLDWRCMRSSLFCMFRHLKHYSVLIDTNEPHALFGVLGICQPIKDVLRTQSPLMIETTLMPFRGVITFDGFFRGMGTRLGPGYKQSFNEVYRELKKASGIITNLAEFPHAAGQSTLTKLPVQTPDNESLQWARRWRITSMSAWDQEYVNAEGPGHFELLVNHTGELHFGYIHCGLDLDVEIENQITTIEFSFEGVDEMHTCSGRGVLEIANGRGSGKIVFHRGDRTTFTVEPM